MKSQRILSCFWVFTLLCFVVLTTTYAQEPKKSKITTSSNAKTTYKPLEQTAADKDKVVKGKSAVKGTAQTKNAAKANASQKQAGKGKAQQAKGKKQAQQDKGKARQNKGKAQVQGKGNDKGKKIVKGEKQTQVKGKKQAGKPAPSAEAKAAAKKKGQAQAKGKQQQQKKRQPKKPERYIALKSNVPFQALSIHNLAVEVQVHKQVTVDFPVMWSISDIEREHAVRGIAFQPEGRWWLKKAGVGHFFGVHAHAAWFNLKWEDNRYQTGKRPLLGAGISYGYKLPLSAHWGAEFNIGAGYANMKYDTFYNIENGAQLDTRVRHYWGITRAGISLVYRF